MAIIAIILSVKINGVKNSEASGNMGRENLKKPYPAIFKSIAASITDPAVGASTCASGNQVWTGHIGIFTAKELKKANHNKFWYSLGILAVLVIFFGFYPVPLMETLNVSVDNLINNYETAVQIESLN